MTVLLLCGPTASGKSYATERLLALEYDVATAKLDSYYRTALAEAGVPRSGTAYSIYKEANRLRVHDPVGNPKYESVLANLGHLIRTHLEHAHSLGVSAVFEGYTLKFRDEAALVQSIATDVSGEDGCTVHRVLLQPTLQDWHRNLSAKRARLGRRPPAPVDDARLTQLRQPEEVAGIADHVCRSLDDLSVLCDTVVRLKRHRWYQRFSLGSITTRGPSDATEKFAVIRRDDIVGKRVVDVACATGAHVFLAQNCGAARAVGIELDNRRYAKALELRKTLIRHEGVSSAVEFTHGDFLSVLASLEPFDTTLCFGVVHYFSDYTSVLRSLARATNGTMYIEFAFSEGEYDAAAFPGKINPYTRPKTGTTIYLGDPEAIATAIGASVPEFVVAQRTPISSPGRASRREIWQLRRL